MKASADRIFAKLCIIWIVLPVGGAVAMTLVMLPLSLLLSLLAIEPTAAVERVLLVLAAAVGVAGGLWLAWHVWPGRAGPRSEGDDRSSRPLRPTGSAGG